MFHRVCDAAALVEGGLEVVAVERRRWLIVWPAGGEPTAFRALCPHQEASLAEATFDGRQITCPHHGWHFDGTTGACTDAGRCCDPVKAHPLRIEDGGVFIDVPDRKKRTSEA